MSSDKLKPPPRTVEHCAWWLEAHGWKRSVAGDCDFFAAARAYSTVAQNQGLGLMVSGACGCGKTSLLNTIIWNKPCLFVNLGQEHSREKLTQAYWEEYAINPFQNDLMLDDLGAEPVSSDFGVFTSRAGEFIMEWHERRSPFARLWITTNFTSAELVAKYGPRVFDRLKDLCVPLRLLNDSKRKWRLPPRDPPQQPQPQPQPQPQRPDISAGDWEAQTSIEDALA